MRETFLEALARQAEGNVYRKNSATGKPTAAASRPARQTRGNYIPPDFTPAIYDALIKLDDLLRSETEIDPAELEAPPDESPVGPPAPGIGAGSLPWKVALEQLREKTVRRS